MAVEKWNEEGRIWEADHGLLNEEQIAQCARADEAEPSSLRFPLKWFQTANTCPFRRQKARSKWRSASRNWPSRRARNSEFPGVASWRAQAEWLHRFWP